MKIITDASIYLEISVSDPELIVLYGLSHLICLDKIIILFYTCRNYDL